jgi:N-acetylglucosamine-6-phosphate deacetylase
MAPFSHREPGVIGAASDTSNVKVELICDGIHIHPSMIRSAFKLFTDERIILISDSMEATGMPNGEYELGGQHVFVNGSRATLKDGTIAGSTTNLMDCVRFLVKEVGIPLESAIKCAAVNPAKAIGIYEHYGSLTPGKIANVVLLNKDLEIIQVYIKGVRIKKHT